MTSCVLSASLGVCFPSAERYDLTVREDHKVNEMIGTLELEDRDEIGNKEPIFTILNDINRMLSVELNTNKDGNLMLKNVRSNE